MTQTKPTALPPLLAAARALELDRDAASSGDSADYRRGLTRAAQLLRILNEDEPPAIAPPADRVGLRQRITAAARAVPLRLGPNAVAMAQRGEPIILNLNEADDLADAVLAELPAPDQQAAVRAEALREAADIVDGWDTVPSTREAADFLRGMADETRCLANENQQAEAEASNDQPPNEEQIVKEHVTTLHLISDQLTAVESWMWQHLADVREAQDDQPAREAQRPTLRERHRAAWNALTPAEQVARIAALDHVDSEAQQDPAPGGPVPVGGVKGNPDYHAEDDERSGQPDTNQEA